MSTLEGLPGGDIARRARIGRLAGTGVMAVVLVLALSGLLGPRKATASSVGGGYGLSLTYGSVVRSGEPVPMTLNISHAGGFAGPVTVAFDRDVFGRFDFQNWYPNPDQETGDEGSVVYQFSPPAGDTLTVVLDARVAPLQIGGRFSYWVAVVTAGQRVATVDYSVWVMP